MKTPSVQSDSSLESLVAQVADDFLARQKRGEHPNVAEYAARYPNQATLLREVLAALEMVEQSAASGHVAPDDETGLVGVLGDFRLLREVGRGGMGVVYEAEQISLGRKVALKVLPFASTMDARQLQRFQNEARAAAGLHHTNIVPVYYVGSERGVHYYAMQFIEGRDLASVIANLCQQAGRQVADRQTAKTVAAADGVAVAPAAVPGADTRPRAGLSTERSTKSREQVRLAGVARLGVQAAEALDYAHQMGIVHRDVKPANLLLDATGRLWITDFGLAQVQSDTRLTMTGDLIGTLRYMSPEQALAKRVVVDHRTDIYSLGATLYELLTLEPVFAGRDRQELLRQIAFEELTAPRRLNRVIPAELETIVLKALEKNPADRYATAQEVADDLRNYLEDRPIRAKRPSLGQRLRKWGRRHRVAVRAAAAGLVALAVVLGTVAWALRDRTAREAETQHDRSVREAETERGVSSVLQETERLQAERKMLEALAMTQQARALLAGGTSTPALEQRVQARLADLKLVVALEEIHIARAGATSPDELDRTDRHYAETFRAAGLDVEELPVEQAAQRLREGTVAVEIAAILEDWSYVVTQRKPVNQTRWKHLLEVARAADPEPLRSQLRAALLQRDGKALKALLTQNGVDELPPATKVAFALALQNWGNIGQQMIDLDGQWIFKQADGTLLTIASAGAPVEWLRQAQRRHPNDFWINYRLATMIHNQDEPRFDHPTLLPPEVPKNQDAIRFFGIATALRPTSPAVCVGLGHALRVARRFDEAIATFEAALRIQPGYAKAHEGLGLVFSQRVPYPNRKFPRMPNTVYAQLALVYSRHQLQDKGIAEYRKAGADPELGNAVINICLVLNGRGERDRAIAEYREAIRLRPNMEFHLNLGGLLFEAGKWDEAITEFRKAIELDKACRQAYFNLGLVMEKKGQLDEAIAAYRKAIELEQDLAPADFHSRLGVDVVSSLGVALARKGQWDEAIAAFRKVVELEKDDASGYLDLGVALTEKRQWDEAITAFRKASELNKYDPKAPFWLGQALTKKGYTLGGKGQLDEKIAAFREASELNKNDASPRIWLGQALTEKGQWAEAIAAFREASELNKNDAFIHFNLGKALLKVGEADEGITELREAVRLAKDSSNLHNALAWELATVADPKLRDPKAAVEYAKKAVELAPTNASYWHTLGVAHYRAGHWKESLEALDKTVALQKFANSYDWFFQAMAHEQLGNKTQARKYYDQAVKWMQKIKPNDAELRRLRAEAAELLGLDAPKPSPKKPPSPPN